MAKMSNYFQYLQLLIGFESQQTSDLRRSRFQNTRTYQVFRVWIDIWQASQPDT